ncbi:MAG: translation initiation factor IF-3 [Oscillospiraceae bacterium]|nr:translation initiation factor IF-3 [Oscillospiraceae bacterium]
MHIGKLDHQLNEEIQDKEIRLIGADGTMLGIFPIAEAMAMADEQELDLVKINPNAVPPVCKIMDYGKFRFDQLKRDKEAKKNQRVVEIKEIRMSPGIDTNDLNTKMRSAIKFLKEGNRVKVTVRFRGREMAHTEIGEELLIRFGEGCAEVANLEKKPKLDGRHMSIFLSSKNGK